MKIRIPLVEHEVAGARCPFPMVKLFVRDRYGAWVDLFFRVDTQADFTTISIVTARRESIPFTTNRPATAYGLVGAAETFRGQVHVRIGGREYEWPCHFVAAPSVPPQRGPVPLLTAVLGRAGFLHDYAVAVDSDYLILTRLGPLRRWWRWCLHGLWHRFGLIHPLDEPL